VAEITVNRVLAGESACPTTANQQLETFGGEAFSLPDFYHGLLARRSAVTRSDA